MKTIVIGVGDMAATNIPGEVIKTLGLGSCVAVVMLHPGTRTVGMVHVALPESSIDAARAQAKPGYFADTGIPALIQQMNTNGTCRELIVKLAGGANVLDPNDRFNIGKRNILMIKKMLWSYGLGPRSEDVGGHISRSVAVDTERGRVIVTSAGRGSWEI